MRNEKTAAGIDDECLALGRYLFGQDVNEYVREKYRAASAVLGLEKESRAFRPPAGGPGRAPAAAGQALRRLCALLCPARGLRKKMVVLLAIAEVTPPTCRSLDAADTGGWFLFFVRTMWKGAGMVLCLLPALIVLLPMQLSLKLIGRLEGKGDAHA